MSGFSFTHRIGAPQTEVFAALTDFEHAADRISGIERIDMLTDGPVGPGTRIRETRVMFKREATEEMEVTEFEQPSFYTLECESCGAHYRTTVRCEADGDATNVHVDFQARPLTLVAKLMSPLGKLMMGTMKKCITHDFEDIATHLERRKSAEV